MEDDSVDQSATRKMTYGWRRLCGGDIYIALALSPIDDTLWHIFWVAVCLDRTRLDHGPALASPPFLKLYAVARELL